jgi:hypothetical protein
MFQPFLSQNNHNFLIDQEEVSGSALCVVFKIANAFLEPDIESILRFFSRETARKVGCESQMGLELARSGNDIGIAKSYAEMKGKDVFFKANEELPLNLDHHLPGWNSLLMTGGFKHPKKIWSGHCVSWKKKESSASSSSEGVLFDPLLDCAIEFSLTSLANFYPIQVLALKI